MNLLSSGFIRRNRHLLFLLLPVSVLAIANVFFEYSLEPSRGGSDCLARLFPAGGIDPSRLSAIREIGARFLWLASSLALTLTSLASIGVSWLTMRTCLPRGRCWLVTLLALALAFGYLAYLQLVPTNLNCVNFELTVKLLRDSSKFSEGFLDQQVQPIAYGVAMISIIATMFLLAAAASTANLPRMRSDADSAHAGIHMARLRSVLYIGSIMLITGIFNMGAWLRWPLALFPPEHANELIGMALGVTTFWGATFTLTAIAAYLPPAVYVQRKAVEDFRRFNPDKTPAEQEGWLKERRLTVSPGSQLIPIAAMAGPLIASPLGALLNHLLKQLAE